MVDIEIRCVGSTQYMVVEDEIVDFTTNENEVENMIDNFIEENELDSLEINVSYM